MKKSPYSLATVLRALVALLLLALALTPRVASAESQLDFSLVNDTGYEINKVFLSPTKSDDWGDDVLGKGVRLPDGESTDITFHRRAVHAGNWDLKILFNDGEYRYWRNFDLTTISEITIHYKNDHATATWK